MSISTNELRRTAEVANGANLSDYGQRSTSRLLEHAADTIDTLREQRDAEQRAHAATKAEFARMREALEEVASREPQHYESWEDHAKETQRIAHTALKGGNDK